MLRIVRRLQIIAISTAAICALGCDSNDGKELGRTTAPGLGGYASFHYVLTLEIGIDGSSEDTDRVQLRSEGSYVSPDSHAWTREIRVGSALESKRFVAIGNHAWIDRGNGQWESTRVDDERVVEGIALTPIDQSFVLQNDDFIPTVSRSKGLSERFNGRKAKLFHYDETDVAVLDALADTGFLEDVMRDQILDLDLKVWLLGSGNQLLAMSISVLIQPSVLGDEFPFEVQPTDKIRMKLLVDLTRLDDPSIAVEPPVTT